MTRPCGGLTQESVELSSGNSVESVVGRSKDGQQILLVHQLRHTGGLEGPCQQTGDRDTQRRVLLKIERLWITELE